MAAEGEDTLVVEDTDCVKELHMVGVAVADTPGYTDSAAHILPAAAVMEVVDLVHTLHVGARILEGEGQPHHSPAEVGNLVVGILEEGIGSAEAADILLSRYW